MNRVVLFLFFFITCVSAWCSDSNEYQWASKVISYSSEYSSTIGSATQILGRPSATATQVPNLNAWYPSVEKNHLGEYIHIGFELPQKVSSIHIFESQNPGAITHIIFYNANGNGDTIYRNPIPYFYQREPNIFSHTLKEKTNYNVHSIKLILNTRKISGFNPLDAVAISERPTTIDYSIEVSDRYTDVIGNNLGEPVNSPFSELAPIISSDGNTLFFTRKGHPSNIGPEKREDVWLSSRGSDGQFGSPKLAEGDINNIYSNYSIAVTQDGNTLLLGNVYNADGTMGKGMSSIQRSGNKWIKPMELEIVDFVNISPQSSFYISYDGLWLFSAIDDGNSFGGLDLYVSELLDDGRWSKPKNLGQDINTAMDEGTPFLTADGKALYFSSAGWPGYGRSDIFVSERKEGMFSWERPLNLGSGINSPEAEFYFTIPLDGLFGYYVSMKGGIGREDIFKVELPEGLFKPDVYVVSGVVMDSKSNEPLNATIYYEDLTTGEKMGTAGSNISDGSYKIVLMPGTVYGLRAEADGYVAINKSIDLTEDIVDSVITENLQLVPIEKGATITLNNIFFDFGKSTLLPTSYNELARVAELLTTNEKMSITILGHTDNIGTEQRNLEVSRLRANAVMDYLLSIGVNSDRISAKGMGMSQPVADNATDKGRAKNRRVEFVID